MDADSRERAHLSPITSISSITRIEWLLLITIIALLYLFWGYFTLADQVEDRARLLFDRWRESTLVEEPERRVSLLKNE